MLTGVCKLTVYAIVLAPRSFINFGNSIFGPSQLGNPLNDFDKI